MKKLHTYIGKHWLGYVFAILCMVIAIVLDMVYPMITESIIDDVILEGKSELLFSLLVGIVVVGVGRSITGYFKEFTFDKLASGIGSEMRKDLFNHVQSLSMNYFILFLYFLKRFIYCICFTFRNISSGIQMVSDLIYIIPLLFQFDKILL